MATSKINSAIELCRDSKKYLLCLLPSHAVNTTAGKAVWLSFLEASSPVKKKPLSYQKSI